MSRKHRDHAERGAEQSSSADGHPGKRTLTGQIHGKQRAAPPESAASTSMGAASDDDEADRDDVGIRAPRIARIIDFVARDGYTLITVSQGRAQLGRPYPIQSVVTPDGRKIADAFIEGEVLANATLLRTSASMQTMEQVEAVVKFEDDLY